MPPAERTPFLPPADCLKMAIGYDHANGDSHTHAFGPDDSSSESIFVPRSAQSAEGEGFLRVGVYRKGENRSDLIILDAENMTHEPLANCSPPPPGATRLSRQLGRGIVGGVMP